MFLDNSFSWIVVVLHEMMPVSKKKQLWMKWNCELMMQGLHIPLQEEKLDICPLHHSAHVVDFCLQLIFFSNKDLEEFVILQLKNLFVLKWVCHFISVVRPCVNLICNICSPEFIPRNMMSFFFNPLTSFRIVDDNLKAFITKQTKNFQAFETHEERNQ